MMPIIKEFTKKIDGNGMSYSINGIKAIARIRVEQNADIVLKNLKLKIFGQLHDDEPMTTERRFKHYKANKDRITLKDGLFSGNTTEKLVASKTPKISYQST